MARKLVDEALEKASRYEKSRDKERAAYWFNYAARADEAYQKKQQKNL